MVLPLDLVRSIPPVGSRRAIGEELRQLCGYLRERNRESVIFGLQPCSEVVEKAMLQSLGYARIRILDDEVTDATGKILNPVADRKEVLLSARIESEGRVPPICFSIYF